MINGDNMDKMEAITELINLSEKQGEHNGRWEDECNIEYTSEIYYEDITMIADRCGIKYAKGDNFDHELEIIEEDNEYINALDGWTFELKEKIETYLIKTIME